MRFYNFPSGSGSDQILFEWRGTAHVHTHYALWGIINWCRCKHFLPLCPLGKQDQAVQSMAPMVRCTALAGPCPGGQTHTSTCSRVGSSWALVARYICG